MPTPPSRPLAAVRLAVDELTTTRAGGSSPAGALKSGRWCAFGAKRTSGPHRGMSHECQKPTFLFRLSGKRLAMMLTTLNVITTSPA